MIVLNARNGGDMSAHHDRRRGRQLSHHAAHFPHLADVHDDRRDAHDVVRIGRKFRFKGCERGEIDHRGGRGDVPLDHENAPRAVEHTEREWPLFAGHLIVIQLHRVDFAAPEFIVLRIRPKDGTEQNTGLAALGMSWHLRLSVLKLFYQPCSTRFVISV